MASFGPALQQERQRRGISLGDVARDTRLARRFLLALENESIADLPGGPYNKAYLRTYATYLGLDPDRLVQNYDQESQSQSDAGRLLAQPDAVATMTAAVRQRGTQGAHGTGALARSVRAGLLGAAALALIGVPWFGARYLTQDESTPVGRSDSLASTPPGRAESSRAAAVSQGPPARPDPEPGPSMPAPASEPSPTPLPQAPQSRREPETLPLEKTVGPTAEVARPVEGEAAALAVAKSGVGTDVVDRQLVGQADTFAVATRVAFWTLVTGGRAGDMIRHVWIHEGRAVGAVDLALGSASWRTQSRRTLGPEAEGDWAVEARDAAGRVLARHQFRCQP
jgi:cytoskeleton protein RodZ